MTSPSSRPSLYLIDGNSYIYRAFHAIPYLSNSRGQPTNAILGFTQMLLKILRQKKPNYLGIAFDHKGKTHRHQVFEEYKIHRPSMPEALSLQLPYIFRLVEAFRIRALMMEGYEADDVLATAARQAIHQDVEVTIVTGDKDVLQLVGPSVHVYDSMKDTLVGEEEVRKRYGVSPDKMVEVMGLMGDASDNIPGVPGVGEKTASSLIQEFGSIDALARSLDQLKRPKLKENLRKHMDLALLSRQLATLHHDLPLKVELAELKVRDPDWVALKELFRELEFYHLLRDLSPPASAASGRYHRVGADSELSSLMDLLHGAKGFSLDVHSTTRDPMRAEWVGIALAAEPGEAYYLPLGPADRDGLGQLPQELVWGRLKPILEEAKVKKCGHDLKFALLMLQRAGLKPAGFSFDTMVASYLLNPNRSSHDLEDLALEYLNLKMRGVEEALGEDRWRAKALPVQE
ncbi:MAG: 5'-3' exonuclease H3TH domain-containing protein, partial [candidate division NC10 bacterium]|nr:5'-3' exonuclease H3TH domain-containing protein [candidate division NC10 bacterium]